MDKHPVSSHAVKKKLSDALFELLDDKGIGSVGISELVAHAGVSRSSFYRNFDSIDDVLSYGNQIFANEQAATCPYDVTDLTDVECVTWHLRFWKEHASKILTLTHSGEASTSFINMFEIGMRGFDSESEDWLTISEQRFAVGAFCGLALTWIENGAPGDEEELAHHYCNMLVNGITAKQ